MQENEIRSIKQANLAKRLFAVIIDGACFLFIFMFFLTLVFSKIADKAFDYSEKGALGLTHQINSHLFVTTIIEDEKVKIVDPKDLNTDQYEVRTLENAGIEDVETIKNHVKYYYLNYKTGNVDPSTLPEGANIEDYVLPGYEKLPQNVYTEDWFNEKIAAFSPEKTELQNYLVLANEATEDLAQTEFFKELKTDLNLSQIFIITLSFCSSYLIIFFAIPVILKNGQTIGKKMFNICLLTKDGYDVKRRQVVFRQLVIFLYVSIFAFAIGIELVTSLVTLMFGVAIYFVLVAVSKTNRSFADYLAYTYPIDSKNSVWFTDAKQEETKQTELSENIKKLRKFEPDNKHVIQIGSKIIDKNIEKIDNDKSSKHHKNT